MTFSDTTTDGVTYRTVIATYDFEFMVATLFNTRIFCGTRQWCQSSDEGSCLRWLRATTAVSKLHSLGGQRTVDHQVGAGGKARRRACEEDHAAGDFFRSGHAPCRIERQCFRIEVGQVVLDVLPDAAVEIGVAGGYGVGADALCGQLEGEAVRVPRARIKDQEGKVPEWRSKALARYKRLMKKAEALIAAVYLSGTNTRRVKRALFGLFEGAVSKDVVSRAWRKVKVDWDAWCARSLGGRGHRLPILDGTVIKTRLDRKATNIAVLAAIGARRPSLWTSLRDALPGNGQPEGAAVHPEHGRREHGGLAPVA